MGISKTYESAKVSVNNLKSRLEAEKPLYKLYMHITWNCQLKCSHCYASGNQGRYSDMRVEDIISIARDAGQSGFKEIVVTGGEPLMHQCRTELLNAFARIRKAVKPVTIVLRSNFSMPLSERTIFCLYRKRSMKW